MQYNLYFSKRNEIQVWPVSIVINQTCLQMKKGNEVVYLERRKLKILSCFWLEKMQRMIENILSFITRQKTTQKRGHCVV